MPFVIEFWHWWILAIALLILEAFAPGAIFLWMGVAAAAVGAVLMLAPSMTWEIQVLIFSVLSVTSAVVWRRKFRRTPPESDHPTLNQRGNRYIGRSFTLDEPIINGVGKIRVDDTTWRIAGSDQPAGGKVTVTAVEGTTLRVTAADE